LPFALKKISEAISIEAMHTFYLFYLSIKCYNCMSPFYYSGSSTKNS